ncbi:protein CDI-like [Typha latifolia]|uniref:protein CDI-like n=1 Tax=Typha latifolia TaxID=4733 RepID=UPI003C3004E3
MSPSSNGDAAILPFRVFIGYDPREDMAFKVCRHSLLKRSSIPLSISPILQPQLRSSGLYWRQRGPTESTDFSFTRFLTPFLAGFRGWAMFIDCDFLYLADVSELVALIDPGCAVMCVKHDYAPKESTKMDGVVQTAYPRKNWSSMVLYNCGHPKNRALTPEVVSTQTGAYLHRFMWLDDDDIGEVSFAWNFLVGHNRVEPGDLATLPRAIHYTSGGPWFEEYKDCEFAELWLDELEEYEKEKEKEMKELPAEGI